MQTEVRTYEPSATRFCMQKLQDTPEGLIHGVLTENGYTHYIREWVHRAAHTRMGSEKL